MLGVGLTMRYRRNQYISQLGVSRRIYGANFVTEKKLNRMRQRYRYGFDYRDIFNMDMSFAEWLYSHMRMYKDNSVHDDTMATVTFDGKEYTIQEAMDWIIEIPENLSGMVIIWIHILIT